MTAQEIYERNLANGSDIGGHMATLLRLGQQSNRITEFGVRGGNSTSCWLLASPTFLRCYDIAVPADLDLFRSVAIAEDIRFTFTQTDTANLTDIDDTDLLFIDTLHTADQLRAELKHHARVVRYIVLHDTETNAWVGEDGGDGLKKATIEFLLANPHWRIRQHHTHSNGLTVLERD